MARVIRLKKTLSAISVPTNVQKRGARASPRSTFAISVTMYCATFAMANGRTATMTRRIRPHTTTVDPESHRMRSTGGTLRRDRRRSSHGLSVFIWLLDSSMGSVKTDNQVCPAGLTLWMHHTEDALAYCVSRGRKRLIRRSVQRFRYTRHVSFSNRCPYTKATQGMELLFRQRWLCIYR